MDIIKVSAVGITAVFLSAAIKKDSPHFSLLLGLAAGIIIIFIIAEPIKDVFYVLYELSRESGVNSAYLAIVIKVIGIAYISEFAVQLSNDAGETSIAGKIELAGKILIMAVSAPIIVSLTDIVLGLF
ncbi:MAG: stage III sporulation protein AD [Firmicutes bacterium]|nr:stage III sporulation protein AD [Bacillota bacterium]MBR2594612.1 stage III sporulation protein AD [Bacillota bacterium]